MYCKLSLRDPDNYSVHAATQSNCIGHLSATSYTFATLCPAIHRVVQPQGHLLRKSPEAKLLPIAIDHEASRPCCCYYMSTDGHMRLCGHTLFEGVSPCNCTFFPGPLKGTWWCYCFTSLVMLSSPKFRESRKQILVLCMKMYEQKEKPTKALRRNITSTPPPFVRSTCFSGRRAAWIQ
ncbi:hypothetical protein ACQJBY_015542 [Aegilops geniculata]